MTIGMWEMLFSHTLEDTVVTLQGGTMKKHTLAFVMAAALCLGLAACGGAAPEEQAPEPEQQVEQQAEPEEQAEPEQAEVALDSNALLDIVEDACPIPFSNASDIKVTIGAEGTSTVAFGSPYGDFSYTLDSYTGEILDRTEPEVTEEQASEDPVENAINACFNSLDGYNGGAEDIKVSLTEGGQTVNVSFVWNGQAYDMTYDTATGEVTQN